MSHESRRLVDLIPVYARSRRLAGKAPQLTRRAIATLAKGLGREPTTDDLRWKTLRRATEALRGPNTAWAHVHRYMQHIRAYWRFLHFHGYVTSPPCRQWVTLGPSGGFLQLAALAPLPSIQEKSQPRGAVDVSRPVFDGAGLNAYQPDSDSMPKPQPKAGRKRRNNRWISK